VLAKEILQCKSTKLLKQPFLLQPLVELDQSSVVYQLSTINEMLCTWVSEGFFPEAKDFSRRGQNGEISFFPLETRKNFFC